MQILFRSHNQNKLEFATCSTIHKIISIPSDFSLHLKAMTTITTNEILGGKQMQMLVYIEVLIRALAHRARTSWHVCGVERVLFVLQCPLPT